jgi:hypothetical protein
MLATISSIVTTLNGAINMTSALTNALPQSKEEIIKGLDDICEKMVTVSMQFGELAADNNELLQSKLALVQQVQELQSQLKLTGEVTRRDGEIWKKHADGSDDGPYCSACYDDKRKLIGLHKADNGYGHQLGNRCPICGSFGLRIPHTPSAGIRVGGSPRTFR